MSLKSRRGQGLYTHPRGFSSRLAGDPTISPRVQNIWPRKSWEQERAGQPWDRGVRKERGDGTEARSEHGRVAHSPPNGNEDYKSKDVR